MTPSTAHGPNFSTNSQGPSQQALSTRRFGNPDVHSYQNPLLSKIQTAPVGSAWHQTHHEGVNSPSSLTPPKLKTYSQQEMSQASEMYQSKQRLALLESENNALRSQQYPAGWKEALEGLEKELRNTQTGQELLLSQSKSRQPSQLEVLR